MNPTSDIGRPQPQAGHRGAGGSAGGAVSMARSVNTHPLRSEISHRTASSCVALPELRKPAGRTAPRTLLWRAVSDR